MFLDLNIVFKLFYELLNIKTVLITECSFFVKSIGI